MKLTAVGAKSSKSSLSRSLSLLATCRGYLAINSLRRYTLVSFTCRGGVRLGAAVKVLMLVVVVFGSSHNMCGPRFREIANKKMPQVQTRLK